MTGDISSEIFHPRDKRVIVRRQARDDFRKNTTDSSSLLHLKNPTVVENSHVSWMKCAQSNGSLTIKIWQPNLARMDRRWFQEKSSVNAAVERLERQLTQAATAEAPLNSE